jgi:putative DNA primase/helicase
MRPVEKVLAKAGDFRQTSSGWEVRCPRPDHGKGRGDREPSVSVTEGEDGQALVCCHAGCRTEDIVADWGLEMSDLFEQRNGDKQEFRSIPPRTTATAQPCTLENYAEVKGLPVAFLEKLGLRDQKYQGRPAVRISYRDVDGNENAVRYRIALEESEEGDDRFRWRTGSKARPYGLWRLNAIRRAGYVVLVEGESDCHTLWYHGIAALGVPGANNWKDEWSEYLEGLEKIYAVIEPDQGGETFLSKLAACEAIRERLHIVRFTNV